MFDINTSVGKKQFDDDTFTMLPLRWVLELSGEDLKRMILLRWRFSFFAEFASRQGEPIEMCFYESQVALCELFQMSPTSQAKVSAFLKKMESGGYIKIRREKVILNGKSKPRHYILVNDPTLKEKYNYTC